MKYPFQPEVLDALPEELAELYRGLEDTLLMEICSRLKLRDELNEVTVQDIKALRSHGIDLKEIEKAIRKTTGISEQKLKKLLDDVVARNQTYYTELITLADVTRPDVWWMRRLSRQSMHRQSRSAGTSPEAWAFWWTMGARRCRLQKHTNGVAIRPLCKCRAARFPTIKLFPTRSSSWRTVA